MDHVREIQEIMDEHKEEMPTGVVTDVMKQCQKAYKTMPNLWKIYYVEIDAVAKNRACLDGKIAIFEETHSQMHHWQGVFSLSIGCTSSHSIPSWLAATGSSFARSLSMAAKRLASRLAD